MSYGQYNESRGGQYGSYPGGSSGGGGGMGYGGGGGYGSTSQQLQQQGLGGGGAGYEQQQQLQQGQQQGGGYGGYQQQQDLEIIAEKVHFAGLMPAHLGDRASRLTSSLSVIAVPQSSATQYQWEGDQGQVGGTLRGWATEGVGINGRKHIKANVSNDVLRFNLWQMEGFQKNRRGKPLATGILPLAELSRVNDFSNAVAIDRFVDLYPSPHLFEGTPAMTDHPIAFVHVMVRRRLPLPSFAAMATGKQRQAMGAGTGAGAAGYGGQQQQFMGGQQQQIPQQQIPQQQLAGGGQPFQTQQAAGQQPIQGLGTSSQAPASYSKQQEFASAGGMGSQYGNPSANIPSTQQSYQPQRAL